MKFKISKSFFIMFLAFLLMIPLFAIARQFRIALLPDNGENFGCGTCHVNPGGGGARNSFGNDWTAIAIPNGDKYIAELADKDSDGDGFTNAQEFEAGTHPGDPESKPKEPEAVSPKGKRYVPWGGIKSGHI